MAKKAYIGIDNIARRVKKGYIGIENFYPIELPSGYTQVDYIQSSGSQYIDTGFKPNNNTRVVMDAELVSMKGNFGLFGARVSANSNNYALAWIGSYFRSDYNTVYTQKWEVSQTTRRIYDKNKETTVIDGVSQSYTNATFQVPVNLVLLANNQNGSITWFASAKLYSCKIYDNGNLIRDYVPCKSENDVAGLYDIVNGIFYENAGTGTFSAGQSYGSYARSIVKGYIGIGGVARPFWSDGVDYYGKITALRYARYVLAATSFGDYALFGGGYSADGYSANVDAYNTSLTRKVVTDLSEARSNIKATTVGDYALFGGGSSYNGSVVWHNTVDAYNKSLTKITVSNLSTARYAHAATTVGNYALFGGGAISVGTQTASVEAFNASLTRTTAPDMQTVRASHDAANVGNRALFGGGDYGKSTIVDVYNASLTKGSATNLRHKHSDATATGGENYAMFHERGYYQSGNYYHGVVDAYNASLTRLTAPDLNEDKQGLAAVTVKGIAMFGGGVLGGDADGDSKSVDSYDASLTRTQLHDLSKARNLPSAAKVGNYALFAGGYSTTYEKIVDAYIVP